MSAARRFAMSWRRTVAVVAGLGCGLALVSAPSRSSADSLPPSGVPATVTADALPTVQIDGPNGGIVWAQAIYGETVYAVGQFTSARPPGAAAGAASSVTRTNILAYNITTGALNTSFVHSLGGRADAAGRALAVSPDGKKLYVGGLFLTVDGHPHHNFAVFDIDPTSATFNTVLPTDDGPDDKVMAIAATNTGAYVGGVFVNAGLAAHRRLAAYDTSGKITAWQADVDGPKGVHVAGLVVAGGNLVVGGSFTSINGATRYSIGAVTLDTGAVVTPWASEDTGPTPYPIRLQPPDGTPADQLGVTSLRTDGTNVYFGAFNFILDVPHPGSFEGTGAISPVDGHIVFLDDCAGDTHDVFPIGPVLYSVSHAHNCASIGGFPQLLNNYQHALAEGTSPTVGVHGPGPGGNYGDFHDQPRSDVLNWFPKFDTGTASNGADDAGWSVVGNTNFVAIGGEFKHVNGVAQQGLVRFAVKAKAPNKVGPSPYVGTYGVTASPANSLGQSLVRVFNASDEDNGMLTYQVYRTGSSHLITQRTLDSRFWWAHSFTFTDTHVPPGTSADYRVIVIDPLGNRRVLDGVTAVNDSDSRVIYRGTWSIRQGRNDANPDFGRDVHYTGVTGASYSYSFYGRSVRIIGERGPDRGTAAVTVDGAAAGSYNPNQAIVRSYEKQLFAVYGLGFGRHTITVRNAGGGILDLDAIRVSPDNSYDDTSASITYSSGTGWVSHQNSTTSHYGHGVHYTRHNGATATVHFRGTQVALMTPTGRPFGRMRVSIDGRSPLTVSAYRAAGTRYQQIVLSRTGLAAGAHTMKITKVSGTYLEIDAAFSR